MKTSTKIVIILASLVVAAGLLYAGLAFYYVHPFGSNSFPDACNKKSFMYGVNINGNDCVGLTADEVEKLLVDSTKIENINIITKDNDEVIECQAVGLSVDYHDEVNKLLDSQNGLLWAKNLVSTDYYKIEPKFVYDYDLLMQSIDKLNLDECNKATNDVYLELTDEGYQLVDNKNYHFDIDSFREYVAENLSNGICIIKADDSYYTDFEYTDNEKKLIEFYDELSGYQSREVTYHFGTEEKKINGYEWDKLFIEGDKLPEKFTDSVNAKNAFNFEIGEEEAVTYIDEFLDEYNTYNNRYFKGHNGAWVHVTKGNYGNKLDIKREEEWFKEFVNSNEKRASRTPVYLIEANHREKNDFGDTFIEISIDEQQMWYYVDGEVYVDTPVTTGSLANGGTAPRVVSVYTIIPNKWLNGPTWHSFVKYWVAIQGAIGIHDASWRSVYGGTEYLYNGSHGCINTPHDAMKKLFERVEIGTPVIVYSIEKNGVESRD